MKSIRFTTADFFVLRVPLLSVDEFEDLLASEKSSETIIREHEDIRRAIECSHPSWFRRLGTKNLEHSWIRLLSRISLFTSPLGFYSSSTLGHFASETKLVLTPRGRTQVRADIDFPSYVDWLKKLLQDPLLKKRVQLALNPTVRTFSARGKSIATYLEPIRTADGKARFESTLLPISKKQAAILTRAASGRPFPRGTEVEALADAQVLIPAPAPDFTCNELIFGAENQLKGLPGKGHALAVRARRALTDFAREWKATDSIGTLEAELKASGFNPFGERPLFHLDAWRPGESVALSPSIRRQIEFGAETLYRAFSNQLLSMGHNRELLQFEEAFVEKYGDRHVPLLEALDAYTGLFSAEAYARRANNLKKNRFNSVDELYVRKISEFKARLGDARWSWEMTPHEISLIEEIDESLGPPERPIPYSYNAIARIVDPATNLVALELLTGPTAFQLLGRSSWSDPSLHEKLRGIASDLESRSGDVIYADLICSIDDSYGNLMRRGNLLAYEIPIFAQSSLPRNRQIRLSELSIIYRDDRLWLYSEKLRKRVVPLRSDAVFSNLCPVPLIRFLQTIGGFKQPSPVGWTWRHLKSVEHLPRVTYKNVILSPELWRISDEFWKDVGEADAALEKFARFRDLNRLPRWFEWEVDDRIFVVDGNNPRSVRAFLDKARRKKEAVRIRETLPTPNEACVTAPEGRYVHGLVVPVFLDATEKPVIREPIPDVRRPLAEEMRTLLPCDGVYFFKLYTNPKQFADLIRLEILPWLDDLRERVSISKWFFVRYADPDPHLRIRIFAKPSALYQTVIPKVEKEVRRLQGEKRILKYSSESYSREIERYGGLEGVQLFEKIAHLDSEAISETFSIHDEIFEHQIPIAALSIHGLIDAFGLREDQGLAFLEPAARVPRLDKDSSTEWKKDRSRFANLYRTAHLDCLKALERDSTSRFIDAARTLERRNQRIRRLLPEALAWNARHSVSRQRFLRSVVHMSLNRLSHELSGPAEALVYGFTARLYRERALSRRSGDDR